MLNKQMQQMRRRRVRNNLRYVAYWQSLKQLTKPDGSLLSDYINKGIVYCNKIGLSSMEVFNTESDLIEGMYKVVCRKQTEDFDVSDRLLFLKDSDFTTNKVLSDDQILRVESIIDKTGRGERLNINCRSGVFVGKAPVEPRSLKNVIFKGGVGSVISQSVLWFLDNTTNYLRAYNANNENRMSSQDINLGSGFWLGAVSDGTNIWAIDAISRTATAFNISNLMRTGSQISLGTGSWVGGMSDGVDIWFINNQSSGSMAIAYRKDNLSRDGDKDINIGSPDFPNPNWGEGTYTNGILYIADHNTGWIRAWSNVDMSRRGDKDINTGLNTITGITSTDNYLWAIDGTTAKAWSLQDNSRQSSKDINIGAGGFSGATSNTTINDLITIPNNPLDLFKIGFTLDVIIRDYQNPWIFDSDFRIPVVISFVKDLTTPTLVVNDRKVAMTKVINITDKSIFYGSEVPMDTNQIYIE